MKIESLYDDYYDYNQDKYALMGRRKNKVYKLGDKVRIFVKDVNMDRSEIDFLLTEFK